MCVAFHRGHGRLLRAVEHPQCPRTVQVSHQPAPGGFSDPAGTAAPRQSAPEAPAHLQHPTASERPDSWGSRAAGTAASGLKYG